MDDDLIHSAAALWCRYLNLRQLLTLRRATRGLMNVVGAELTRYLEELLEVFVPNPRVLLASLTGAGGFIGGDVAVHFLLRVRKSPAECLDLFVADESAWRVENTLVYDQGGWPSSRVRREIYSRRQGQINGSLWGGVAMCSLWEAGRASIKIHHTCETPSLIAITRAWASHHIVYVNGDHFGCGNRDLLYAGRSVLGDGMDDEKLLVVQARKLGIDVKYAPYAWGIAREECGAAVWACASQPRGFDDGGALQVRVNPLTSSRLGVAIRWRLDSRPCGGGCMNKPLAESVGGHGEG